MTKSASNLLYLIFLGTAIFVSPLAVMSEEMQAALSFEEFVKIAESSSSVKLRQQGLDQFAEDSSRNLIENTELKLGKSFEEDEKKTVSLKVTPRGFVEFRKWGEVRSEAGYIQKLSRDLQLNQSRFDRMKDYLDYWHQTEKLKLSQKKFDLAQHSLKMTQIAVRGGLSDTKDLLQAQQDSDLSRSNSDDQKDQVLLAWEKIRINESTLPQAPQKTQELIDASELVQQLKKFLADASQQRPENYKLRSLELVQRKKNFSQADVDMAAASKSKLVESVEVKLSEDRREKIYSVELGFNLPGFSQDPGIQEKRRKLIDAEIEAKSAESLAILQNKVFLVNLKQALKKLEMTLDVEADPSKKRLRRMSRQQDPLMDIRLEKDRADAQLLRVDQLYSVLLQYFIFLHHNDFLVDQVPQGLWK